MSAISCRSFLRFYYDKFQRFFDSIAVNYQISILHAEIAGLFERFKETAFLVHHHRRANPSCRSYRPYMDNIAIGAQTGKIAITTAPADNPVMPLKMQGSTHSVSISSATLTGDLAV
jgi:hypothetical protein